MLKKGLNIFNLLKFVEKECEFTISFWLELFTGNVVVWLCIKKSPVGLFQRFDLLKGRVVIVTLSSCNHGRITLPNFVILKISVRLKLFIVLF